MTIARHIACAWLGAFVWLVSGAATADSAVSASGTGVSAATGPGADYSFCTVCHGAQGNGNPAINAPKIAGIEPWYLKRQLESFRAGVRGTKPTDITGIEMQPVGVQLDDSAIAAVVSYVATFDAQTPPTTVKGNTKRGRELYTTCSGCHGARGEGNSALMAPALAGQTDWYLVTQLTRFRNGERGFAAEDVQGTQMQAAARVLPDDSAVTDLVAYINTLSAPRRGS